MKWISESKEIFGAIFLTLVYFIAYFAVEEKNGDGTDFILMMGLFWLMVIALRMKR